VGQIKRGGSHGAAYLREKGRKLTGTDTAFASLLILESPQVSRPTAHVQFIPLLFIRSLVHDIYSTTPTLPTAMTSQPSTIQRTLPTPNSSPAPPSKPPPEPWLSSQVASYFIAGGIAGAASRTVVSPLERLKIIQCASSMTSIFGV
jgi:hypothetical protein